MRINISHLLELWDENDLASLSLKMDSNAVKTSQIFHFEESSKGILMQTDCTKEYLQKLEESSPIALVRYNEELVKLLKDKYPDDYKGIYTYSTLKELSDRVKEYDFASNVGSIKKEIVSTTGLSDSKGNDYLIEGDVVTSGKMHAMGKNFSKTDTLEYKYSDYGVMLVTSNRIEETRLKFFLTKNLKRYDGVRIHSVVTAKEGEDLTKTEARALINNYKNASPRAVVIAGNISYNTEKEIYSFDRLARCVRTGDEGIINDDEARKTFFSHLDNAYFSNYKSEYEEFENREALPSETKEEISKELKALNKAYSHKAYLDIMNALIFSYREYNVEAFISKVNELKERSELHEGKY